MCWTRRQPSRVDSKSEISMMPPGFLTNVPNDLGKVTSFMDLSLPSTT